MTENKRPILHRKVAQRNKRFVKRELKTGAARLCFVVLAMKIGHLKWKKKILKKQSKIQVSRKVFKCQIMQ